VKKIIVSEMFDDNNTIEQILDYLCDSNGKTTGKQNVQHGDTFGDWFLKTSPNLLSKPPLNVVLRNRSHIPITLWSIVYQENLCDTLVNFHYARLQYQRKHEIVRMNETVGYEMNEEKEKEKKKKKRT